MTRHSSAFLAIAAIVAIATPARGSGFSAARFGGEQGHPTTDNPTAIYFNPAGLALGSGTRIFAEGMLAFRTASYDRPVEAIDSVLDPGEDGVGTPDDAIDANSGEATLGGLVASPFLGVASNAGIENLGLGIAFYAPFGGQASWDRNDVYSDNTDYPGAVDGTQRWQTIEGALRELYISFGGAYRLPGPRLSFGVSFNLIRESINTVRARTVSGTDDMVGFGGSVLEGRSLLEVSGLTFSAAAGVIWEASDQLRLGLSYQSQPGFGETRQTGTLTNKFGGSAPDESQVEMVQSLPDVIRVGTLFQASDKLQLRLFGDYTRWSVFQDQCLLASGTPNATCALDADGGSTADSTGVVVNVHRAWKDTFGVRTGASYLLAPAVELEGGVAFDSNAVPASTMDASLMDMNKVIGTLGARYQISSVILGLSYSHVYYFTRTTPVRARDGMGVAIGPPSPSEVPDSGGKYKQMVALFNLAAEVRF